MLQDVIDLRLVSRKINLLFQSLFRVWLGEDVLGFICIMA